MHAPKNHALIFVYLYLKTSSLVFARMVSRLSTIQLMEKFRVNALMDRTRNLMEPVHLKMELAGMYLGLLFYLSLCC